MHIPICAEDVERDGVPTINYLVFDIVYDFTTEALREFTASILFAPQDEQTAEYLDFYKYKDDSVVMLAPTSPKEAAFAEEDFNRLAEFNPRRRELPPRITPRNT